jgi:3-hydroxyacyl-[acyl-carrier-protein] dehydratase
MDGLPTVSRFLLIDRIVSLDVGVKAAGFKVFSPDEEYFRDHFPGYPIVPGVLLLESMAQLGGRLLDATTREQTGVEVLPVLATVREARFQQPVRPGERLDVAVEILSLKESMARIAGTATVGGRAAASAEIAYGLLRYDHPSFALEAGAVERLRSWSRDVWRSLLAE